MVRNCIILDDEDQSETIEKLTSNGIAEGLQIRCEQFNVGSPEFTEVLTNGEIDVEKVIKVYREKFRGITFQLAIFDWQLTDEKINGIELIRQLNHHNILKNTPKFIISGLLRTVLKEIVSSDDKHTIQKLTVLVNNGIKGYYERDKYEHEILLFLKSQIDSLDLIIEEELRKFPDLKFKVSFIKEHLKDKNFLEIAEYLENNILVKNQFKREIVQQVIAHLTEEFH